MFKITSTTIDTNALQGRICNDKAGAIVIFEGWVRNHNEGQSVDALEYSAYDALCINEANIIIAEAKDKYDILEINGAHRTGLLDIGDVAIFVAVTSKHRKAAFEACGYLIDQLKARLPIWKKEHYTNGDTHWINCQQCSQKIDRTLIPKD